MRYIITSFLVVSCWTLSAIAQQQPAGKETTATVASGSTKIEFRIAESQPSEGLVEAAVKGSDDKIYLYEPAVLTRDDIAYALAAGTAQPAIEIGFTEAGSKKMSEATTANLGGWFGVKALLAVIVDGEVISASTVREVIAGKMIITGAFSAEEARRIAWEITPRPVRASMLLIKADWSQVETAEAEIREALDGAAVPQELLDRLPASAPEILFPNETMSLYTPQHYGELLAWLKAKSLVLSIDEFPDGKFERATASPTYKPFYPTAIPRPKPGPVYTTSAERPMEFLDVPEKRVRELVGSAVPRPFITKKAVFRWEVRESQVRSGNRQFEIEREILVLEAARGQAWRETGLLDSCKFGSQIPAGHVAITNAFPDDDESQFREAARRKGFVALIVSAPVTAEKVTEEEKGRVRPPDMISTLATKYGGNDFWPQEADEEVVADDLAAWQADVEQIADAVREQFSTAGNIEWLQTEYEENERGARATAAELREQMAGNPSDPEAAQMKSVLKLLVAKSLAIRVRIHELELAELEVKLKHARDTIRQRRQIADQIIDDRVRDLLKPDRNPAANQSSMNSTTTETAPTMSIYISVGPKSFVNGDGELAVHKKLVTSDAVLTSAIREHQLSSLSRLASQDDPVAWLRDNLIVRSTDEGSLSIALTGVPDDRAQFVLIVNAVRMAYEKFVAEHHQSVNSEVVAAISAERAALRRQLAAAQAEYDELRSADGTTEAEEEFAKRNVARIRSLLDSITEKLEEVD